MTDPASTRVVQAAIDPPTFVVTVTHDGGDNQLRDGRCDTAAGGCSLRAAIQQANADSGPNRIEFDIAGDGPHTIEIRTGLPPISDQSGALTIDGYTQPGSTENTDPYASNAQLQIIVRPLAMSQSIDAIRVTSPDNVVRGLSVVQARTKILLSGPNARGNRLVGNFIGTDPDGVESSLGFTRGIYIVDGANHNIIGTPQLADRNVISGNRDKGVLVEQNDTDHNVVQNNIVGLTPNGLGKLPQGIGIDVQFGPEFTLVGGNAQFEHNVFSGQGAGIDFSHNTFNNAAIGNYIGTGLDGTTAETYTYNRRGIMLKDDARRNTLSDNIIVNAEIGIWNKHNYNGANEVLNNLIGLTRDGTSAGTLVSGLQLRGHDDVIEGNVFANSMGPGIHVDSDNGVGANDDEVTERNRVTRNVFFNNQGSAIEIQDADVGTQGRIARPVLETAALGSVSGRACASCGVEVYLADLASADSEGRQYLGTVTAGADGSFSFDDPRIVAGQSVTALVIDAAGNTSEFGDKIALPVGPAVAIPTLQNLGTQTTEVHASVSQATLAAPAGASYSALNLPDGLSIDPVSGVISGVVSRAATFEVTVWALNARGMDFQTFLWNVVSAQSPPVIDPIADLTSTDGEQVTISLSASDANGDEIAYAATGLPPGVQLDSTTGVLSGLVFATGLVDDVYEVDLTASDSFGSSSTSFDWTIAPTFRCEHVEGELRWSSAGASTYYVSSLNGGERTYLGSSTGLSTTVPPAERYLVRSFESGRQEITCDGPLAPTTAEIGETGSVSINHYWLSVNLERTYENPVVVVGPLSRNGVNPAMVRVRNVTSNSFELMVDEWDYLDGTHVFETVSYLVVEAGSHVLDDGTTLVAGRSSVNQTWRTVSFESPFDATPVVLSQVATVNGSAATVTRQRSATNAQFEIRLQEEEAADDVHFPEDVHWVAVTQGPGSIGPVVGTAVRAVDHELTTVDFERNVGAGPLLLASIQSYFGGDPVVLRYVTVGGQSMQIFVEEELSQDSEIVHFRESVGYVVFDAPTALVAVLDE